MYVVTHQPSENIPVYVVKREVGNGRPKTLHRNHLLPISFLPLDESNRGNDPKRETKTLEGSGGRTHEDANFSGSIESSDNEFPIIVPRPRQISVAGDSSRSEPRSNAQGMIHIGQFQHPDQAFNIVRTWKFLHWIICLVLR